MGEPSPGADVSTGGPSPGADVGGVGPVRPGADVESGGPSLGAERGRGEPSPGAEMPGLGSPARWTDARTFLLPLTEASISRLTEQAIAVWHSHTWGSPTVSGAESTTAAIFCTYPSDRRCWSCRPLPRCG